MREAYLCELAERMAVPVPAQPEGERGTLPFRRKHGSRYCGRFALLTVPAGQGDSLRSGKREHSGNFRMFGKPRLAHGVWARAPPWRSRPSSDAPRRVPCDPGSVFLFRLPLRSASWPFRSPPQPTTRHARTPPTCTPLGRAPTPRRSWASPTVCGTSTPTSPSRAGWRSTATTTASASSTSPTPRTRGSSPTPAATATRATSWSGETSWSGRGTPRRPRAEPATGRRCPPASKAFTCSTSATPPTPR
jgi:hypothetical protein